MIRASMIFVLFTVVSPAFRGFLFDSYAAFDQLIRTNTTIAYALTGLLGFGSFLAIRLTAKD